MKFGVLKIKMPDGKVRDYPIDQPSLAVGRTPDGNELVIDDNSVSRRHAELSVESGHLMIKDLSSANGTFIGSQRISPNTPSLVPENEIVRLGDVEIRYSAPPLVGAEPEIPPPPDGKSAVPNISLVGSPSSVEPGRVTTVMLTVQNRSPIVDEMIIRVTGLPADWVRLSKDRLTLLPGAQDQVVITFMPPRRPDAAAGSHVFSVVVNSRPNHTTAQVYGTLEVQAFPGFTLNIRPVRARRDFQLIAYNLGNTAMTYCLSGLDDEAAMSFDFKQIDQVTLRPGQRLSIPLRVKSRIKPLKGMIEIRRFTITASTPDQLEPESKTAGELILEHHHRRWPWVVLLLIVLIALIGGALYFLSGNPPYVCQLLPRLVICPQIY